MKYLVGSKEELNELMIDMCLSDWQSITTNGGSIKLCKGDKEIDIIPLWWSENKDIIQKEYTEKYFFTVQQLVGVARAINKNVDYLRYFITDTNEEYVSIIYDNGDGKKVCVTADSLRALALDVLKEV